VVVDRAGQIEFHWQVRARHGDRADIEALMRFDLLQRVVAVC
jgi:hypothetical protein